MLWTVIFVQVVMGGFDAVYHHELTERLALRSSQLGELRSTASRLPDARENRRLADLSASERMSDLVD